MSQQRVFYALVLPENHGRSAEARQWQASTRADGPNQVLYHLDWENKNLSILGFVNGLPIEELAEEDSIEERAVQHDPHSGRFMAGGGSAGASHKEGRRLLSHASKQSGWAHQASADAKARPTDLNHHRAHTEHSLAAKAHENVAKHFSSLGDHKKAEKHSALAKEHHAKATYHANTRGD